MDKPLVYLILGAAGSGRREVLADLLEGGLGPDDRGAVMLSDTEVAGPAEATLGQITRWRWTDEGTIAGTLPEGATHVFFLTDGRRNPVDQIEVFGPWLKAQNGEIGRVVCVVNCQLGEKNPPLLAWYDACIHFSDVALLTRRDGVANKWLSDFQSRYADLYYPCLFEFVKHGRVKNPALVLEPQARRMSHVFDEELNWVITDEEGEEIEESDDEEAGEEEVLAAPEVDPYFALDAAGRRVKKLPDIAKFL